MVIYYFMKLSYKSTKNRTFLVEILYIFMLIYYWFCIFKTNRHIYPNVYATWPYGW